MRARLIGYLSRKLSQPAEKLSTKQPFQHLGLDSLSLIEMVVELENFIEQPLETSIVLDHPSIEELSAYVARIQLASQTSTATHASSS